MLEGLTVLTGALPKFRRHFRNRLGPLFGFKPFAKRLHSTGKHLDIRGVVDFPNSFMQFVLTATAIMNLKKTMQETEDRHNAWKECGKRILSQWPA